ncbi:MAG: formate/nitrite transporter family protein [Lachnospiraceae bacterium]|nr:formate/nitrite transporter family protein [Lachnospiraceae bacterium]
MENFLTIKEAVNKYIEGCDSKVASSPQKLFIKAVFAGMMIAMGAAASSVASHAISNVGVSRLAAALVFPVGLMMVILLGAELFTGDCLMIMATASEKHSPMQLLRTLLIVFAGNFVGAVLIAIAVAASGQLDYSTGLLGAYTIKVALGKATISFSRAIVSGVLCNILVCSAVLMALCAKDIAGKLIAVFFTIMLFVVAGFEHCVANMYYIAAGMVAAVNPEYMEVAMHEYGYTAEQISMLNLQNFLVGNLLPVTIGNIIGGMLFIGLPLLYLNREQKKENYELKEKDNARNFIFRRNIAGIGR